MIPGVLTSAGEAFRALCAAPLAEYLRVRLGPSGAVAAARHRGARCFRRDEVQRKRLQRVIARIDGLARPNCYRRALMEMMLDAGAAGEPLLLGFRRSKDPRSGHAWLPSHEREERPESYDLIASV